MTTKSPPFEAYIKLESPTHIIQVDTKYIPDDFFTACERAKNIFSRITFYGCYNMMPVTFPICNDPEGLNRVVESCSENPYRSLSISLKVKKQ